MLCHALNKPKNPALGPERAEKCGYIIFKDRSVVIFYTNDLAGTPKQNIERQSTHTIRCVQGLAPMRRWMGNESMHRTLLHVPAVVVAYNMFMNGVDKYDQYRSTNAIVRKEKRVPMSIFTFLLDASIQNAFTIMRTISAPVSATCSLREFKRRVAESLVTAWIEKCQRRATLQQMSTSGNVHEDSLSSHQILETEGKRSTPCKLCKIMAPDGKRRAGMYSCAQCNAGFHVNCFTFYHRRDLLQSSRPELYDKILLAVNGNGGQKRRDRKNNCTSDIGNASLPFAS